MRLLIYILAAIALAGCVQRHSDPRLDRADALMDANPKAALDSLKAIEYGVLSDADRHYYDFLAIKAADKAFIPHASDSLVLDLISYYSDHDKEGILPEALYYGGRVYSDLGDYPASIKYYQDALDLLPPGKNDDVLGNVLSQYGLALSRLRLYEQAIPYIEAVVGMEERECDTINQIYDLQRLGDVYLKQGKWIDADNAFKKALRLSQHKGDLPYQAAKSKMYLAGLKSKLGQTDSALNLIRGLADEVNPKFRGTALCYAANIYYEAGIMDIAFHISKEIISGDDAVSKLVGYQVILSPKLIEFVPKDSFDKYIWDYRKILERTFDDNQRILSIQQENLYNYNLHEKARLKAERSNGKLKSSIVIVVFIAVAFVIVSLYFKNKSKDNRIKLLEAMNVIENMKSEIDAYKTSAERATNPLDDEDASIDKEQGLRVQLQEELKRLYELNIDNLPEIAPEILQSDAYQNLQEHIGKGIGEEDMIWKELEEAIALVSPDFKRYLYILTSGRITQVEYHTAILIKCGIRPSKMISLLNISNGGIVSRRESIGLKIFDEKKDAKIVNTIIRLM